MNYKIRNYLYRGGALIGALFVVFVILPSATKVRYDSLRNTETLASTASVIDKKVTRSVPEHIDTPAFVKALYLSSWVAGTPHLRDRIIEIVDTSEINALVIDIKDNSGKISFQTDSRMIENIGSSENRIEDIEALIRTLHEKDVYIIGRIAVFQDEYFAQKFTDQALQKKEHVDEVWKDSKGITWLDPSGEKVLDYVSEIAEISHELGFDEINFDYVEFPIEGNGNDVVYPLSGKALSEGKTKNEIIENFFSRLHKKIPSKITTSVNIFDVTTPSVNNKSLLIKALPYFDYVAPVIYPSSFPLKWNGYENPAVEPYNVVLLSMKNLISAAESAGYKSKNIRPWLQDFDFGTSYTKDMVRLEIDAVHDSGVSSWMLWNPSNRYTQELFLNE